MGRPNTVLFRIQKIFAVLAAVFLVSILGLYIYLANLEGKRAAPLPVLSSNGERPLFFAHRGGGGEAPENTFAAFEKAIESGVDVLEIDVRTTADEKLVVFHDGSLERTTNGSGPVSEKNLDQLKKLDAGYAYTPDGGQTFPFRGKAVEIPTLREVFRRYPEKLINLEVKNGQASVAKSLCGMISEFGRKDRVIVASTGGTFLAAFRNECDGVATSASFGESLWFLFLCKIGLSENFSADMQALQIPERLFGFDMINPEFIAAAKERNLKIHIWTANKKSDIKRLLDAGVDGVMTDFPSLLREIPAGTTR